MPPVRFLTALACAILLPVAAAAQAPKDSASYRRLKAHLDAALELVAAGHQRGARWRAGGADVEVGKADALVVQAVEVRRPE